MKYATYEENLKFVLEHNIGTLSVEEMETIINTRRGDPLAYVNTSEAGVLSKIKKLLAKDPKNWTLAGYTVSTSDTESLTSVDVTCPKRLVSLRSARIPREYTEEEKKAIADKLHAGRDK